MRTENIEGGPRRDLRSLALAALLLAISNQAEATARSEPSAADGKKDAAREHYERAVALYRATKLAESLAEFQHAYELAPHFAVLFNIGQIKSELGEPAEAIQVLHQYLREGEGQIDVGRIAEVEQVLAKNEQRVGYLQVEIQPPTATVLLDGKPWVPSDPPQAVALGSHVLEARCDGYLPQAATIRITPGARLSQNLRLVADPRSIPQPAWANAVCPIAPVTIQIDDRAPFAMASRNETFRVSTGRHRLRFARGGYSTREVDIDVTADRIAAVDCRLERLPEIPSEYRARLEVRTADPAARVLVDDSPFRNGSIATGRHRVKVLQDPNQAWEKEIDLRPSQAEIVVVEPPLYWRQRANERSKNQQRWAYIAGGTGLVLAAGAVTSLVVSAHRYDEWEAERNNPSTDWSQAANKAVGIQRIEDLGVGLGIAGIVCLATSAYLWFSASAPEVAGRTIR